MRSHLFPCRTQKLSSSSPTILGGRLPGKIGFADLYAPLAQMVEQLTLNQWVLGSSPRWCTIIKITCEILLKIISFASAKLTYDF